MSDFTLNEGDKVNSLMTLGGATGRGNECLAAIALAGKRAHLDALRVDVSSLQERAFFIDNLLV